MYWELCHMIALLFQEDSILRIAGKIGIIRKKKMGIGTLFPYYMIIPL